jgi:hypothetical protein
MPEIRAQRDDGVDRPKAPPQQPHAVQFAQPLAIRHIALPPRDVFHVPGIDEVHLKPTRFEDLVDRDPVDPGRFHRDARHAAGREPVREPVEVGREGRERSHGHRIPIGRHGHEMFRGTTINARNMGVDAFQHGRGHAGLDRTAAAIVFHRRLLHTARSIREQGGG